MIRGLSSNANADCFGSAEFRHIFATGDLAQWVTIDLERPRWVHQMATTYSIGEREVQHPDGIEAHCSPSAAGNDWAALSEDTHVSEIDDSPGKGRFVSTLAAGDSKSCRRVKFFFGVHSLTGPDSNYGSSLFSLSVQGPGGATCKICQGGACAHRGDGRRGGRATQGGRGPGSRNRQHGP